MTVCFTGNATQSGSQNKVCRESLRWHSQLGSLRHAATTTSQTGPSSSTYNKGRIPLQQTITWHFYLSFSVTFCCRLSLWRLTENKTWESVSHTTTSNCDSSPIARKQKSSSLIVAFSDSSLKTNIPTVTAAALRRRQRRPSKVARRTVHFPHRRKSRNWWLCFLPGQKVICSWYDLGLIRSLVDIITM